MAQNNDNPVEALGMYVAHVGINAQSPEEAEQIAKDFSMLMGLPAYETPIAVFSGTLVETMKGAGRGTNGHIGFHVDDMPTAEKWFTDRGFELNEESRALTPDGATRLIYFKREIGGFAIHLTTDK